MANGKSQSDATTDELKMVYAEDELEVPLYEEADESSNIISLLENDTEVTVIEELEMFSLVSYIEDEDIIEGYINNQFLVEYNNEEIVEEETENTEENKLADKNSLNSNNNNNIDEGSVITEEDIVQIAPSVQTFSNTKKTLYGIASHKMNVYEEQSKKSKVLKSYNAGASLKYQELNSNWYEAVVIINGERKTGYIHKDDVENITENQESLRGIALQSKTHVFARASTTSKKLRSYNAGAILKYRTFSKNWYEATVILNGKRTTGYIHKSHVENAEAKQVSLQGIALKSKTHVYATASTSAKKLRTYNAGTILKYRTFSKNWYEATVILNGKRTTGYIHKSHVENADAKKESLQGIALKSKTHVYATASTSAKKLRSYNAGTILKYRTFSKNWYEATVILNGKRTTGYIHKSHVENLVTKQESLQGVAQKKGTKVYQRAATNSKVLRTYSYGSILKFKTLSKNWYEAVIILNGKPTTSYIRKADVEDMDYRFEGYAHKNPTAVYSKPQKSSEILRTYDRGSKLIYRPYNKEWYRASVKINNKWHTGYIHVNDVHFEMRDLIYKTSYGYDYKAMVDRQARKKPNADGGGKIQATRGQIEFYTNPLHFTKNTDEYFQFLVLSQPAGVSANQINSRVLNNNAGVLKGKAQAFINAGKKLSINEIYLIAHAMHETGNGKSTLASGVWVDKNGNVTKDKDGNLAETNKSFTKVYNMFGNGALTSCPIECGAKYAFDKGWTSVEKAIEGGIEDIAAYIHRGQDTLYKMRWNPIGGVPNPPIAEWRQYATHIQWATLTAKKIAQIYRLLDDYTLEVDVPTFKNLPNYKLGAPATSTVKQNVRSSIQNGKVLISVPKNAEVLIIGSNVNEWYKVRYKGTTGWLPAKNVRLKY